jgi:hypothetical protein
MRFYDFPTPVFFLLNNDLVTPKTHLNTCSTGLVKIWKTFIPLLTLQPYKSMKFKAEYRFEHRHAKQVFHQQE